ncbi:ComEC/Rec2 family competence protein [uncultured Agrococcus sp.]|uniref:ComEC/Rec2 family competence protein n=1 Tax=uncultured Agrococcus sp. TaxID=382258 RepID=UPI0025F28E1A|nr:ComEC/Rec2 family competence protein [uncultured Agrococcus sp.]
MKPPADFRLAIPVATGWLALALVEFTPVDAGVAVLVAGSGMLVALLAAILLRRRAPAGLLALIAVACAIAALLVVRGAQEPASVDAGTGRCDALVRLDSGNALPAAATVLTADCGREHSSGPVILFEAVGEHGEVQPGELGFGTVLSAECDTWSFQDNWVLDCTNAHVVERPLFAQWSAAWRASFQRANEPLPGDGGALLAGLAIGDTSRVDETLQDAMLEAGLSHLTAVSGANCAIVTAAAFGLSAALGARRWVRISVALAALAAFVVLVTPEPSVVRASLMAIIALLGFLRGQPRGAVPLLSLAVLVGLIVNPTLATSVGFVLSVLATAGLIVHSKPIAERLADYMPAPLAFAIAVPVAAQLWVLPVLILLDNGVQPLSVLWNLAAAPAAPVVTVVGLVACMASQFVPVIGTLVAWLAWPAAAWIASLARLSEAIGPWRIPWAEGLPGALLAAVGITGVAMLLRRRRLGIAVIGLAALLATGLVSVPEAVRRASLADWRVVQCDVDQGHATLVRVGGATVLIDTGEHEDLLEECLQTAGVRQIDVLFLTHFDLDHSGAAPAMIGRIGTVVHGPMTQEDEQLVAQLREGGADAREVGAGARVTVGQMVVNVLWPEAGIAPGNPASLALAFQERTNGGVFLVILGDLGEAEQRRLIGVVPESTLLLAAHHCSADQHPPLYDEVGADAVLVGVGENSYGHPTDACLQAITGSGGTPLRTDEHGTIAIMHDGSVWFSGVD